MKYNSVVFREYDIRGVYQKDFDESFAEVLGYCFAQHVRKAQNIPATQKLRLVLGHDARLSGPSLKNAVSTGFQKAGAEVLFLGLITSPIMYFATFEIPNVNGGIMVTGSHNPPDYNGFKLSVGNQTIFGDEIQRLRTAVEEQFRQGSLPANETKNEKPVPIFEDYVKRYKKEFGNLSGVDVVLDCGNGAAGCITRELFSACGLNPEILFEKPDGLFPNHHPDPTVEKNLVDLKAAVLRSNAVCGIGFDGDADRIGVVDHTGRMVYGDELMVIISRSILAKTPGSKIVGDVKCSDRLFSDIAKAGGKPILWKTGHSLIKEKIKIEKAPFGGEMSGHIFFADRNYGTDDALYAALRLIEILRETKKSIPELLADLPPSFCTPELRIDTTEEKKITAVQRLKSHFSDKSKLGLTPLQVDFLDGIRVSYKGGWALVRSSNTQPVLVMRFEASSSELLETIRNEFESVVKTVLEA